MNTFQKEYDQLNKELSCIQEDLTHYPKGNLRVRMINNKKYHYLQYREGKRVKSRYIKSDDVAKIQLELETRKDLEKQAKDLENRLSTYAKLLGIHRSYRPVKDVNYDEYTLFMSTVAHDHKSMSQDEFLKKYDITKYRGINKRYLAGYLDYICDIERPNTRKANDLVLDPYTYLMYFKYGQKNILNEELPKAIPAFLSRGLLITKVPEAVSEKLTVNAIKELVTPLLKKYSAKGAILFGSYARGEATEESDIDIMVLGGKNFDPTDVFCIADELNNLSGKAVDVYEEREIDKSSEFYKNILKDGIIF